MLIKFQQLKCTLAVSTCKGVGVVAGLLLQSNYSKAPVTPSHVSRTTALAWSFFIFRSAMTRKKTLIFFAKKGLSQRPRHCYGTCIVFYRVPTEFLLAISLLSHDAFTAVSRHSQCMHYAFKAFALR